MLMRALLRSLLHPIKDHASRPLRLSRLTRPTSRPQIEYLDDRLVPASLAPVSMVSIGSPAGSGLLGGSLVGSLVGPFVQQPQTITFIPPAGLVPGMSRTLTASASSGLPISSYSVVSGPAVITNFNVLTLTGAGPVTVKAVQLGNASWAYAEAVRTFGVTNVTPSVRTVSSGLTRQLSSPSLYNGTITLTNTGGSALTNNLRIVLTGLTPGTFNTVNKLMLGTTNLTAQMTSLDNGTPVLNIPKNLFGTVATGGSLKLSIQFYLTTPLKYTPTVYQDI